MRVQGPYDFLHLANFLALGGDNTNAVFASKRYRYYIAMSVSLTTLRYFVKVVETGGFRQASNALGIAQPALSRRIRLLEAELGTALLVRHQRGVTPTEAGALLRDRAEQLVFSASQ